MYLVILQNEGTCPYLFFWADPRRGGCPHPVVEGTDFIDLPDGTTFAVTGSDDGTAGRTVGFLVDDLDAAVAELRSAGVATDDEVSSNDRERYVHFWAPDGHRYELVQPRA